MNAKILLALALSSLGTGCAGAHATVVADGAQVPVSLSRGVRGADGRIVLQKHLLKVGRFRHESTAWSLLYTAIPIAQRKDISAAINQQVAASGGQAVVNLAIRSKDCPSNWLAPLTWIPLWPGCTTLVVEGDIVKEASAPTAQTLAAEQPLDSWLHERCAFVGQGEPRKVAGEVVTEEGSFLCGEPPPDVTTAFSPADTRSVLCLDAGPKATCVPPLDPTMARQHAEAERAEAERARAEAAARVKVPPSKKRGSVARR